VLSHKVPDADKFCPSTVGLAGETKYSPEHRRSYVATQGASLDYDHKKLYEWLEAEYGQNLDDVHQLRLRNLQVIKYPPGGFFQKHTDHSKDLKHAATMIFIPPKSLYPHTGGELMVERQIYAADSFDKWRVVMWPVDVEHEVFAVTSGERVCFKYEVWYYGPEMFQAPTNSDSQLCDVGPELLKDVGFKEESDEEEVDFGFGLFD